MLVLVDAVNARIELGVMSMMDILLMKWKEKDSYFVGFPVVFQAVT